MGSTHGITPAEAEDLIRRTRDASERDRVLALRDGSASAVVNGLQWWLDSNAWTIDVSAQRRHAIRLLADLAAHSEQVPDGHYLTGVKYDPLVPNWYGGYSDVHEGTWSTFLVVVKRLRVNEGPKQKVIHKRLCIEGLTWRQFDHPNIVKFLGVYREENEGRQRLSLVSVRIGDHLRTFLHSTTYNPHADRKRLLIEISGALAYLHDQGIAHGDVSLKNVVVNSRGQPLLTDFGLIAVGDGSTGHLSVPQGGTVQYMAPEFLFSIAQDAQIDEWTACDKTKKPELQPVKTTEGDVFAYGRLILAISLKDDPFGADADTVVVEKVKDGYPRTKPPAARCHGAPLSDMLWQLAAECSLMEREMRPTISAVLQRLSEPGFDA